jgi:hypothetical protein
MKLLSKPVLLSALTLGLLASADAANWTAGMTEGKVSLKSAGQLAFGPDGILFVADAKAAAVVAIATGDTKAGSSKALKIAGVNQKIAGLLGTTADQIMINDMVVNPVSRNTYVSVSRGRGAESQGLIVLVKADGQLEAMSLDKVKSSRAELPDAPADAVPAPAQGQGKGKGGGGSPRQESITDLAFLEDRVLVAGLSNEEFSSTLRAIPFPFKTVANGTSVEIYHGAHGKFETRSPIRTFVPFNVGNQPQLLAAYTCTPLVQFPMSDLKPGAKIKGKTIAELGNRNRPIDMIVYKKGGKDYLLLANNSRGVMKIGTDNIEKAESITDRVADKKGLGYQTIDAWTGVEHLATFDADRALLLRRGEGGALDLEAVALP